MTSEAPAWRKSSYSGETNCLEMAEIQDGEIAIRNSKHPHLGVAVFTRAELHAFLLGVKAGEFDDLA